MEMTRKMALERLAEEAKNGDREMAHGNADDILCELLVALGYGDVIAAWRKVEKWYA